MASLAFYRVYKKRRQEVVSPNRRGPKINPEYTKIEGQMDALDSGSRKKVNYLQRETS